MKPDMSCPHMESVNNICTQCGKKLEWNTPPTTNSERWAKNILKALEAEPRPECKIDIIAAAIGGAAARARQDTVLRLKKQFMAAIEKVMFEQF